jgi:predicted metal-dependent HD superfamily phosphohydrolase
MIEEYLSGQWEALCHRFAASETETQKHFDLIIQAYREPHRAYHTLNHVAQLLQLIEAYGHEIKHIPSLQFAAFFHDVVYKPGDGDNERNSAKIASTALSALSVPESVIADCELMTLLTRSHADIPPSTTPDMLLFLDMDLSILGSSPNEYAAYCKQIRMEFKNYPELLFQQGRKKFLKSQLQRSRIYHTDLFQKRYGLQARENMLNELNGL